MEIKIKNTVTDIGWLNEEWFLIPTIVLNYENKAHSFYFLKFLIEINY